MSGSKKKHPIVVPPLGESVTDILVGDWKAAAGQYVQADTVLWTASLDKMDAELTAPASGVLEIVAPPGTQALVGDIVGYLIEETTLASPPSPPSPPPPAPPAPPLPPPPTAVEVLRQRGLSTEERGGAVVAARGPARFMVEAQRTLAELTSLETLSFDSISALDLEALAKEPSRTVTQLEIAGVRAEAAALANLPRAFPAVRRIRLLYPAPAATDGAALAAAYPELEAIEVGDLAWWPAPKHARLQQLTIVPPCDASVCAWLGGVELPRLTRLVVTVRARPGASTLKALLEALPPTLEELALRARSGVDLQRLHAKVADSTRVIPHLAKLRVTVDAGVG